MQIYVYRNNNQSGPHDEDVIKGQLASGGLSPADLGCRVGDTQWIPLGEMYPDAVSQVPSLSATSADAAAPPVSQIAKKGGCLRPALLTLGVLGLVLGIIVAIGGRYIPSVSCELYESDSHNIDRLRSDIEKAKQAFEYDRVAPLQLQLEQELAGAEASKKNCDDDKLRNNAVSLAGVFAAFVGLLMTIIGLFVGRKR